MVTIRKLSVGLTVTIATVAAAYVLGVQAGDRESRRL